MAPQVVLKATHRKALEVCALEDLVAHAIDGPAANTAAAAQAANEVRGWWAIEGGRGDGFGGPKSSRGALSLFSTYTNTTGHGGQGGAVRWWVPFGAAGDCW